MEAIILIILLVPIIIILSKIGNIIKDILNTNVNINLLNSRLTRMSQDMATKDDLNELANIILNLSIVQTKTDNEDKVQPTDVETVVAEEKKEKEAEIPTTQVTVREELSEPAVIDPSIEEILNNASTSQEEKEEIVEEKHAVYESQQVTESSDEKVVAEQFPEEVEEIVPEKVAAAAFVETPLIARRYLTDQNKQQNENERVGEKSFFEKFFGENLLTKIGIITLVLGVAFFVKYAIDQEWINEIGRVGIGILTGAILIGIAHKLRKEYHVFSALLVGGGIAVFYFTITLAFREYKLFSQPVAFGILIGITILSVAFSLLYDRKELAIFSLLGGFASPLMISTGEGNYIVLFSFIFILNTGMLVLASRKNWHIIGTISYVLTLVFYLGWLIGSFDDQIAGGLVFATLFFVQFYILTVIDHFKANSKLSAYHAILLLSNNLFLLASTLTILYDHPNFRGIAIISIAIFNAIAMITLYKTKKVDSSLIYLLIAIIMSLVTLAIPIQLNGNAITMFWAAESVILLWLWKRSQIKMFAFGFAGVSFLFISSYIMDLAHVYDMSDYYLSGEGHPAIIFNRLFMTGLIIVLSYVANICLTKENNNDSILFILPGLTFKLLNRIFKVLLVVFTYIIIHVELDIQLAYYTDVDYYSTFRYLGLISFAGLYVAALALIVPKRIKQMDFIYGLLFVFMVIYSIVSIAITTQLRSDIFYVNQISAYPTSYFSIHFLPLIALTIIITLVAKISKTKSPLTFKVFCWITSLVSVIVLSVEAENIATMMFNQYDATNYNYVLHQVHTFVFPILWGVIAMVLMVWGLKAREVVLRQISLVFFGVIIVKFYAYDVWRMSQAGRIISFVLLGVILLVVSFLQQKIKILIKKDEDTSDVENNNSTTV